MLLLIGGEQDECEQREGLEGLIDHVHIGIQYQLSRAARTASAAAGKKPASPSRRAGSHSCRTGPPDG